MSTKGFVLTQEGRPTACIPITDEELIRKTEQSLYHTIDHLRDWFDTIAVKKRVHRGIWNIEGRENILSKAEYMIFDAEQSIVLSGWTEDLLLLRVALEDAVSRGDEIIITSYGKFKISGVAHIYEYEWQDVRKISVTDLTPVIDRKFWCSVYCT